MKRSFGGAIKVAAGMVSRKRKRYEEEEGGEEQGEGQGRGDEGIVTRRMSAGRMSTRSDMVVVQPSPTERRRATTNGGDKYDGITVKEANRGKGDRQSDGPSTPTTTPPVEREKTVTLDLSNIKNVSAKASGENTPIRSTNGSISGTSAIQKPHGKSLRSKGTNPQIPQIQLRTDRLRVHFIVIRVFLRSRRYVVTGGSSTTNFISQTRSISRILAVNQLFSSDAFGLG